MSSPLRILHLEDNPADALLVRDQLATEYHEFTDHGHFGVPQPQLEFPELLSALAAKLV